MLVTLIHNEGAGDESHSREALVRLIERAGHRVEYQSIDEPGWSAHLALRSDLVAVAGGDGSVRDVMRALAGQCETPPPVTVLPLGSANNIAESLGLADHTVAELVAGWARGSRRPLRLGEMTVDGHSQVFVETVGGGLFAELLARAERLERPDDDKVELGLRTLEQVIADASAQAWQLEIDGVDCSGEFLGIEAMLISRTGPGMVLAPDADTEDSLLHVVQITEQHRAGLLQFVDERLNGRPANMPHLVVHQCQQATLRSTGSLLRIDDEIRDDGTTVRVRPTAATIQLLLPT